MASGARILFVAVLLSAIFLLFAGTSFAAPTFSIDSTDILPGTTDVVLDFNISGVNPSDNIDSVSFDLTLSEGLSLTDVTFVNVPSGWSPAASISNNRFGATDFGWPANPLTSDISQFAQLNFSIDPAYSTAGNIFDIDFGFYDIADADGSKLQLGAESFDAGQVQVGAAAPLPSALILFGCGLAGMIGFRRKLKS
jgi:hypothetical protein